MPIKTAVWATPQDLHFEHIATDHYGSQAHWTSDSIGSLELQYHQTTEKRVEPQAALHMFLPHTGQTTFSL